MLQVDPLGSRNRCVTGWLVGLTTVSGLAPGLAVCPVSFPAGLLIGFVSPRPLYIILYYKTSPHINSSTKIE